MRDAGRTLRADPYDDRSVMRSPCDACIDPCQGLGILAERGVNCWSSCVVMSEGRHTSVLVARFESEIPPLDYHTWLSHCWTKRFFRHLNSNDFVYICDNDRFIMLILYWTLTTVWRMFDVHKVSKTSAVTTRNCLYTHRFAVTFLILMLVAMFWIEAGTFWILLCATAIK